MTVDTKLRVVVHFAAAKQPYEDHNADRSETIGAFKSRVLNAFGLTEGPTPEGTSVTYTLYHDKLPLENASQTLGDVAGDRPELQLKLAQQVTQGA
jgi:hypothetical protein